MAADRQAIGDGPLYMTREQYFALDDATDGLYEFFDGYVIMLRPPSSAYDEHAMIDMAGGSLAHAAICSRLTILIGQALGTGPCLVYSSDVRLDLAGHHYFHPDVAVSCSGERGQMLTQPIVIIEVLSPNTEKGDRGTKFKAYRALPSLQEYVLVGSTFRGIEVHRREGNFWRQYHYQADDLVELTSIGVSFRFEDVYRGIPLE